MMGTKAIKIITSRFKWISDTKFRFINQSNIDCIFEIVETETDVKLIENQSSVFDK